MVPLKFYQRKYHQSNRQIYGILNGLMLTSGREIYPSHMEAGLHGVGKTVHFVLCTLIHMQTSTFCLSEKLKVVCLPKKSWAVMELFISPQREGAGGALGIQKWHSWKVLDETRGCYYPRGYGCSSRTRQVPPNCPLFWGNVWKTCPDKLNR